MLQPSWLTSKVSSSREFALLQFQADRQLVRLDSNAPTWLNNLDGQVNLRDAVRRQIAFKGPNGKEYKLNDKIATLIVRYASPSLYPWDRIDLSCCSVSSARGWHLDENHILVDGQPMSGSIFDFGLYFFHNAKELLARGYGPYF